MEVTVKCEYFESPRISFSKRQGVSTAKADLFGRVLIDNFLAENNSAVWQIDAQA